MCIQLVALVRQLSKILNINTLPWCAQLKYGQKIIHTLNSRSIPLLQEIKVWILFALFKLESGSRGEGCDHGTGLKQANSCCTVQSVSVYLRLTAYSIQKKTSQKRRTRTRKPHDKLIFQSSANLTQWPIWFLLVKFGLVWSSLVNFG